MADDVVGWVPGPTERGTLTLVWSCVITIFACTWTVLHLNVPGHDETPFTVALRKTKWMVINILFPEFVFSKAVCDLRLALQELREFDDYLRDCRMTLKWESRHDSENHIRLWSWEIAHPDGWSGLLYDLLRLQRPPHPLKLPAENVVRKDIFFRRFLSRCIFGHHLVPARTQNTALELEDRQSMDRVATGDRRRTEKAQRKSYSIDEVSPPERSQLSPSDDHVQGSVGEPRGDDHARVDGSISEPHGSTHNGHTTSSRYPPSVRTISQQWTVTHSYYAQMGGLAFPAGDRGTHIITASQLTERYKWDHANVGHPLMHLVLGKDEIQDKSKADWLLRSLAVLQVAWIIINVIVRHINELAVSQIEIATVAFAIMAVLIYSANWWKPKDISQPTMLQFYGFGERSHSLRDRKQSFTRRILSPSKAIDNAEIGVPDFVERVANDVLWLEGDIPLLFYLMAGSSFIFGGLHCLAWNFEFPTRVELICWRVASLASAILPVMALAISTILGYLAASKAQRLIRPRFSEELNLILPDEPRQHLMSPTFENCHKEHLYAFARMQKHVRDWEKLSVDVNGLSKTPVDQNDVKHLIELARCVSGIDPIMKTTVPHPWREKAARAASGMHLLHRHGVFELWRDYENFVMSKHSNLSPVAAAGEGPVTTYLYHILDHVDKISTQVITFKKWADRASNVVSIISFILYTAARLIILVLCFTSLRAAPAGLYQDNVWTRFLPKIS